MSKSSELDRKVKTYILNCVSDQAETVVINDIIKYISDRFVSEYQWNIDRIGRQAAMREWLQGLALNIDYDNHAILELAKKWNSIPQNASEKQEDKILSSYWCFMAAKTLQLVDGYRLPKEIN